MKTKKNQLSTEQEFRNNDAKRARLTAILNDPVYAEASALAAEHFKPRPIRIVGNVLEGLALQHSFITGTVAYPDYLRSISLAPPSNPIPPPPEWGTLIEKPNERTTK